MPLRRLPFCLPVALTAAIALPAAHAGEPAGQGLDTVLVTASRIRADLETERAATPGAVTVVDGATFHERGVHQMADAWG